MLPANHSSLFGKPSKMQEVTRNVLESHPGGSCDTCSCFTSFFRNQIEALAPGRHVGCSVHYMDLYLTLLQIASTAKKLWDVQDSGEENQGGMTSGIFFGEQWRETAWGPSVPHMAQSEHAVSQPIMVQRPAKGGNFNTTSESQSVLSPRSADGVGLSMVEYVLASSPGGQELDAQIIKAGFVSSFSAYFVILVV